MTETVWIGLGPHERAILLEALSALRGDRSNNANEIDLLAVKLFYASPHPDITVGVHGGQVQWTSGNPFPIRVCDYDGCDEDLPDLDESGQRCRMWFEPASATSSA